MAAATWGGVTLGSRRGARCEADKGRSGSRQGSPRKARSRLLCTPNCPASLITRPLPARAAPAAGRREGPAPSEPGTRASQGRQRTGTASDQRLIANDGFAERSWIARRWRPGRTQVGGAPQHHATGPCEPRIVDALPGAEELLAAQHMAAASKDQSAPCGGLDRARRQQRRQRRHRDESQVHRAARRHHGGAQGRHLGIHAVGHDQGRDVALPVDVARPGQVRGRRGVDHFLQIRGDARSLGAQLTRKAQRNDRNCSGNGCASGPTKTANRGPPTDA